MTVSVRLLLASDRSIFAICCSAISPHFVLRQRPEDHDLVDAVAELRTEAALELAHDFSLHLLDAHLLRVEAHRAAQFPEALRPDVRRHDDDRVAQVNALAAAVGDPALVERLQEEVQHARARLLHLVEQHDRVRIVLQLVREHATALRTDDPARHADQLVDGDGAVLIFRHVDADHFLLVAEQELGDRLRQLRLADAGRAEEEQDAVGPVEAVLQRTLVQHEPPRDGVDRLALSDDARAESLLDVRGTGSSPRGTPCPRGSARPWK